MTWPFVRNLELSSTHWGGSVRELPAALLECIGSPTHPSEVAAALAGLLCAFDSTEVAYMSVPVTTGPLFVDWYQLDGQRLIGTSHYASSHLEKVIRPNVDRSRKEADLLRARHHGSVLNPGPLIVKHWTQADYISLFLEFIRRAATKVVVCEGWELSKGCTIEATAAILWRIPVVTPQGSTMRGAQALARIEDGLQVLANCGMDSNTQQVAASILKSNVAG